MSDQTPAPGVLPASPTPGSNTLRDQIAEALITRIKQATIPDASVPSFGGSVGHLLAATEYDLADAAITVILPFITDIPSVSLADPCVECGESIDPGGRVSWRLRWSPQGLIHEECR